MISTTRREGRQGQGLCSYCSNRQLYWPMIKALLIDDEERAIDSLQLMIEKFIPEIEQVRSCSDASKCVEVIHEMKPDLVFLDVRMPHLSGFDILSSIPKQTFSVIFTTAYDE